MMNENMIGKARSEFPKSYQEAMERFEFWWNKYVFAKEHMIENGIYTKEEIDLDYLKQKVRLNIEMVEATGFPLIPLKK